VKLEIHVHHFADPRMTEVLGRLARIEEKQEAMMATLEETLTLVTAETTQLDSVIALIDGLKAQLDAALEGAILPPSVQAKVDAIFAAATANAAKIVDALDTNVPPPEEPPTP
jgi:hypothetical protein